MKRVWLIAVLTLGFGCQSKQLPDPNDPPPGTPISAESLQSDLIGITNLLSIRRGKREIGEVEFKAKILEAAKMLVAKGHISTVEDEDAWRYAEVLRAAEMWKEAIPVYTQAIAFAKKANNNDRWVNDSLRLSQAQAHLGDVPSAISTARTVFGVPPKDTVPILFAVSLEIVPAAEGKGHDAELAKLLEDAIVIGSKATVDANTPEGKAFIVARRFHIDRAMSKMIQLYEKAGKKDDALAAATRLGAMVRT